MSYLILVRHGESRWNIANKFTGWVDVPLSKTGIQEAQVAAKKIKHLKLDIAFTSKLVRAQETLLLILSEQEKTGIFLHQTGKRKKWSKHAKGKEFDNNEIAIYSADELNERYYGELQGMDKDEMRKKYGKDQVHFWRRGWDIRPPKGESLKDVYIRVIKYYKKYIQPQIEAKKNVIVVAHGNSLRALIKHLDGISDEQIPHLELELGKPRVYKYTRGKLVRDN